MAVYRAEITYELANFSPAPVPTGSADDVVQVSLYLLAQDNLLALSGAHNYFGIRANLTFHSYGAGPTWEYLSTFTPIIYFRGGTTVPGQPDAFGDPWTWDGVRDQANLPNPVVFRAADGDNGAAWKTGGMLAIEKNTATDAVTYITPLGSYTLGPTDDSWTLQFPTAAPNKTPLVGYEFAHELVRGVNIVPNASETARWKHFFSFQDGLEIAGAELSAADPGLFTTGSRSTFPVGGAGNFTVGDTQLSLSLQTGQTFDTPGQPFADIHEHILSVTGGAGAIDLIRASEHKLVFEALISVDRLYQVNYRRTRESGLSWLAGLIYREYGKVFSSPSISYIRGVVRAVWADSLLALYQANSVDAGNEWSMPLVLPYTGTNPRHIIHPDHGITLYFFFTGGDLRLARSPDYGNTFLDAAPLTVKSPLASQQLDAEFGFDGSVIVSYFDGGAWNQLRSYDVGLTW